MATPSPHALTQHLLSRLEADLAFLHSQQLLSLPDLDLIRSKLAPIHAEQGLAALSVAAAVAGPSGAYAQQQQQGQQRVPPPPPVRAQPPTRDLCRAVWDYAGGQADDLSFRQGDVISVDEEVNADWWKGSLNGRTGLFPRNHVERISSPAPSPVPVPLQGYHTTSSSSWAPPAPSPASTATAPAPASFAYQQPQAYGEKNSYYGAGAPPPPHGGYQPPAPAPAPVPPAAPPKKQHKFAKQMGTSLASGAGFGVGASLASEAVHAIF